MLDLCFSWYLGNIVDGAIVIIKYWCLFAIFMLEGKHGLGVGEIDRLQFCYLFYN